MLTDHLLRALADRPELRHRILRALLFSAMLAALGGAMSSASLAADKAVPAVAPATKPPSAERLQFNRDIRPILSENCLSCHGFDAQHRKADLRLDTLAGATDPRDGQAALIPGDPAGSLMLERMNSTDPSELMPPPESGKKLTPAQIELIRRWIAEGATYESHWSFIPPKRPAVPELVTLQSTQPGGTSKASALSPGVSPRAQTVDLADWGHPIDRLVLARMHAHQLSPSPPADRATWLRRVTLDLTGVSPSREELTQFLADARPDAFERVVDRLLASPRYGERMALHWLDLARYADTNGYNNDEVRSQWLWRDWVIEAFNRNQPYDQFITEQLAGDLLPNPAPEQRIATAFNRNHVFTTEGGIIEEEYRVEYVADRVHTTATVFLGLSLQCARCHDHKFDPLTMRDYYGFFSFFNNLPEKTVPYNQGKVAEPFVRFPSRDQQRQQGELLARKARTEQQWTARQGQIAGVQQEWEQRLAKERPSPAPVAGLVHHFPLDEGTGDLIRDAVAVGVEGKIAGKPVWNAGRRGQSLEFDGQTSIMLGDIAGWESNQPFSIACWIAPNSMEASTVLSRMDEGQAFQGYDLIIEQGRVALHLVHHWPDNALKVITQEPLSLNEWHHLLIRWDGSRTAAGFSLLVDGQPRPLMATTNTLQASGTAKTAQPFRIGRRTTSAPFRGKIDDVRLFDRRLTDEEASRLFKSQELDDIILLARIPSADRTAAQSEQLRRYYLDQVDEPARTLSSQLADLNRQLKSLEDSFPATMVMQELPQPRQAFLLNRGQYDQPTEPVSPAVPASLPALPAGSENNRLGLARWLTDPQHPLTARVTVNRWWGLLFGTGLVETAEDFGSQGAWPTHPELLDWMAREMIDSGWNTKSLLRQIVLSQTYRQSSVMTPEAQLIDSRNRWLSRGPRFRLPAEMIRDNALSVSDLLAEQLGGPSVKPYQPAGLWEDVAVERRDIYQPDKGAGLYRRSLYTFWKRTCPPPGLSTFDAPDRETCLIRRARTNTPLQALVLLNDPTYLEAARKLAERVLLLPGLNDAQRFDWLWEKVLCRTATETEKSALNRTLSAARARFQTQPELAKKFLAIDATRTDGTLLDAELSAWTTLCSLLLSLDETITKE